MDVKQIRSFGDFREYIESLAKTEADNFQGALEEYMRSLWGLIQDRRNEEVSYALLAQILDEAFSTEPVPFEEKWLVHNPPLDGKS